MEITPLNEGISVASQIRVEDVAELVKAGFKSIICNRPDGEEQQQPSAAAIEQAARAAGLMFAQRTRRAGVQVAGRRRRRLWQLSADGRGRQDHSCRIRFWREIAAQLPQLADRRHPAFAAVVAAQGPVYWHGMLKGREWMVKPHMIGA